MLKKRSITTLLGIFCCTAIFAQGIKTPAASPRQVITQDFGLSTITINYSRPGVKGRTIFGGLVPYDKEWRTGANAVTTIDFGQDVKLEGHDVKAGKYALYTIPGRSSWTIILNKDVNYWGTQYSQADDVLRFTVPSYPVAVQIESFTINMDHLRDTSAIIYMIWDHTYVPIHVTTEIDGAIMAQIAKGMKSDKKPYYGAAGYYLKMDRNLGQALKWSDEALKEKPKSANIYYLKAQIQAKMNDKAGALTTAKQGLEVANATKNSEYAEFLQKLITSLQ